MLFNPAKFCFYHLELCVMHISVGCCGVPKIKQTIFSLLLKSAVGEEQVGIIFFCNATIASSADAVKENTTSVNTIKLVF
jgi:hypothetical protein